MTTIAQLPSDITAVIMPVAFFPGSDVATSQVMCASDKVAAWNSVVQGQPPKGAKECGPGSATVNLNTRLFSGVGFTATPTIVADNGKVMIGEGSVSDLQTLLK
jgi:protein-disulfide isomerase